MSNPTLQDLQDRLNILEREKSLEAAKKAIQGVVGLIFPDADDSEFRLFRDSDGKLTAKAGWFYFDDQIVDRRATYTLGLPEEANLDVKVFGISTPNSKTISWAVGLTPNYEDEPFNGRFNVGIDFVIPESKDRLIIALSKNYVIRTIELKGTLTPTFLEILSGWNSVRDTGNKEEFHEVLWNSLDLQPINKKFYEGISQRFINLRQHIEQIGVFDNQHAAQFSNRLIGRVIFSWFLDKKELLDGSVDYFDSESFENATNYYRSKLEPLFFEVLNTPVEDRVVFDLATPYLNGGLFEPKPEDHYKDDDLTFPANYFDELFDFMRGYNFTTDESTSDFQQVAIDPEMLGRIFENLLAEVSEDTGEQARKAKGAFYTPRDIVDFMCKESLKAYLRSRINKDENLERRLMQLIDATEREFHDQAQNWRRDLKPYKEEILVALDELRVIDPACGSGAFPIGMMQLLVKVHERLDASFNHHKGKLSIIEKNIYGVDIEPMAVEISRLRAWLAIVVDEEMTSKNIKPLPNLDFKFLAANSLIPLEQLTQPSFFEDNELDSKLQQIRDAYFGTGSLKQKAKLKEKYLSFVNEEISIFGQSRRTAQLKTFRPFESDSVAEFFDPEQMFGFSTFDIVIGNPPYVRQEKIKYKDLLRGYSIFTSTSDLYTYFYELALKTLKPSGVLSYITSSKFGRALYGEKLRGMLSSETTLDRVVDFGTTHVFAAITNTWVVQCRKDSPQDSSSLIVKSSIGDVGLRIEQSTLSSSSWSFADGETATLLEKIKLAGTELGELDYQIYRGLLTGCNEAFMIDEEKRNELLAADPRNSEIIRPLLRGRDIGHYLIRPVTTWILATKNGLDIRRDYPTIAEFLEDQNEILEQRVERRGDKGSHWMNLREGSYYQDMEAEKIVWIELSDKNKFAYSTEGEYILAGAFMLAGPNMKFLLGVLNSRLIKFYFDHISNSSGMGTTQWKKFAVERLPIPIETTNNHTRLAEIEGLVETRNSIENDTIAAEKLEDSIDELVYELYGLNSDEIELIRAAS
jgi:type I restriction-modification system DNA methylase subunit